jgi:hypothetical protein
MDFNLLNLELLICTDWNNTHKVKNIKRYKSIANPPPIQLLYFNPEGTKPAGIIESCKQISGIQPVFNAES